MHHRLTMHPRGIHSRDSIVRFVGLRGAAESGSSHEEVSTFQMQENYNENHSMLQHAFRTLNTLFLSEVRCLSGTERHISPCFADDQATFQYHRTR